MGDEDPPPAVGRGVPLRTECLWAGDRPLRDAMPSSRPEDRVEEEGEAGVGVRDSEAGVEKEVEM